MNPNINEINKRIKSLMEVANDRNGVIMFDWSNSRGGPCMLVQEHVLLGVPVIALREGTDNFPWRLIANIDGVQYVAYCDSKHLEGHDIQYKAGE